MSGRIAANSIAANVVSIEGASGRIAASSIAAGSVNIESASGGIALGSVHGDASVSSTSGSIELDMESGSAEIRSTSGRVRATISESAGDVSIATASGSVTLNLPRSLAFNFSSRTSSGSLSTPFDARLFNPLTDRRSAQGVVSGGNIAGNYAERNIDIKTGSGSIRVNWTY